MDISLVGVWWRSASFGIGLRGKTCYEGADTPTHLGRQGCIGPCKYARARRNFVTTSSLARITLLLQRMPLLLP